MKTNLLVCLCFFFAATARADQYSFALGDGEGQFNVIDAQPYVMRGGPPGNAVDFREDKFLVHYDSKKKLAFPLDGDKPELLLGEEQGRGTTWTFTMTKYHHYTIQVSEGKFKDWYLDIGKEENNVMHNGKMLRTRKFVLVEKPAQPRAFEKYVVSK